MINFHAAASGFNKEELPGSYHYNLAAYLVKEIQCNANAV